MVVEDLGHSHAHSIVHNTVKQPTCTSMEGTTIDCIKLWSGPYFLSTLTVKINLLKKKLTNELLTSKSNRICADLKVTSKVNYTSVQRTNMTISARPLCSTI